MNEQEWLEGLKVGDTVIVDAAYYGKRLETVSRLTSTQIVVGNCRYRRDNGRIVGSSTSYHTTYLRMPTPEKLANLEAKALLERVKATPADTPLETLRAMVALLDRKTP